MFITNKVFIVNKIGDIKNGNKLIEKSTKPKLENCLS